MIDKKDFLQTYIQIESQVFVRADKIKRHKSLIDSLSVGESAFSFLDIVYILNSLSENNITISRPLAERVVYPILRKETDANNFDAIKLMLMLYTKYGYSEKDKYTEKYLLELGFVINPNDKEFLILSEKLLSSYFEYTLHELPHGILYGADGATEAQCIELLSLLDRYEIVCKNLQAEQKALIDKCRYYYGAYKNYLPVYKEFCGFADFLKEQR
ncbi:MAG: hypothetical protein LBT30_04825 [Clostridiales bacterium]|jgi:hypothetical protein|nr:hypothetical protein [Clostridiales bacterium]